MTDVTITIKPRNRNEAFSWLFHLEDYSLLDAWNLAPLTMKKSEVVECLGIHNRLGRKKYSFIIHFKKKRLINDVTLDSLPSELADCPVTKWNFDQYFLKTFRECFLRVCCGLAVTRYIFFLSIWTFGVVKIREILSKEVSLRAFEFAGSCATDCAQRILRIHTTFIFLVIAAITPIVISVYNLARARKYSKTASEFRMFRFEAALLLFVGVSVAVSVAHLPVRKYLTLTAKYGGLRRVTTGK